MWFGLDKKTQVFYQIYDITFFFEIWILDERNMFFWGTEFKVNQTVRKLKGQSKAANVAYDPLQISQVLS